MSDAPSTAAERRAHWDGRYTTIGASEVSWYEAAPTMSLDAFDAAGVSAAASVLDVGAGASHLVDGLLDRGFADVTVLDVSEAALAVSRARIGERPEVTWVSADVLEWEPTRRWTVWHDRAVFHFLTGPADRVIYRGLLHRALEPDGIAIVATFAADGPEWCSGLPVRRYDPAGLAGELGSDLKVLATGRWVHHTPSGGPQPLSWVALRR